MTLIFLGIVFLLIIVLLALKRPLYIAIAGGLLGMILLYRMPVSAILGQTANVFINWSSLSVLVSLYLICVLQRMLAARNQIRLAGQDLNNLFHNRRVNAIGAPLFIGLLPSAAAMILCGDIVREATDGYLDPREQGYITSWIRHIPESTLPTYSGVLLMGSITGLPLSKFILAMIIPCIVLLLLKKKSPKNFLLVALCALMLILFIFTTSFSSTADYYKTAPEKKAATGKVTLSILCDKVPELESSDYLPRDGVILPATVFDIAEGDTVYTVLTDAARAHEIHLESSGPDGMIYMRGIDNLYELQYGDLSGWIYFVNGTSPSLSCDQYTLQNGDTILWRYSCEMGSDL